MQRQSGRHFLQIPGPTNIPDRVLRAIDRPTIDHRSREFPRLGRDCLEGMIRIFQTTRAAVSHWGLELVCVDSHEYSNSGA